MHVRCVLTHFRIPGIPGVARFRIQPDHAFTALVNLLKDVLFAVTVVIPRITKDDYGRSIVYVIETFLLEVNECLTVVCRTAAEVS